MASGSAECARTAGAPEDTVGNFIHNLPTPNLYVHVRQTNLTLLQTYGPNAWRIHNYLLEATAKQTEKTLEDLKQLTIEVNRDRKNTQVSNFLVLEYTQSLISAFTG